MLRREQRKDMLRAVRRPRSEQAVARQIEQAAAVGSHETGVPTTDVLDHLHRNSPVLPNVKLTRRASSVSRTAPSAYTPAWSGAAPGSAFFRSIM
jgi:hypothetical protein